jgi:invasion protein IalB
MEITTMINMTRFAATAGIVLAIASVMITIQPTTTAAPPAADSRSTAGTWFVEQIEKDTPERVRRALNLCVSLHLGSDGKVDWQKAKACYASI